MKGIVRTHFLGSVLVIVFVCMSAASASAQSTDLLGIAHVALRVDDLQKSRDFYKTLGFEEARHRIAPQRLRSRGIATY